MSNVRNAPLALLGLICALPACYFVIGSALKYELGYLAAVQIREFHPIVLVGGLLLSLLLNLWPFLSPKTIFSSLEGNAVVRLKGRVANAALAGVSGICILVMLLYVITENIMERGGA